MTSIRAFFSQNWGTFSNFQNKVGEAPPRPPQIPKSAKLLSNKLLKCYSNAFKNYWNNNTGTICLNMLFLTWNMFLHIGLAKLHMFFMT